MGGLNTGDQMSLTDPSSTQSSATTAPLQSTLSSDPDMAELVEFFVDEMADRVATIRSAAEQNDLGQLRVVAHQLKGAGTGYGFEPITVSAGTLEQMIKEAGPAAETASFQSQIDDLISLCSRATV